MKHELKWVAIVAVAGCCCREDGPGGTVSESKAVLQFREGASGNLGVRGLSTQGIGIMPILSWLMTGDDTTDAMAAAEEAVKIGPGAVPGLVEILGSKAPRGRGWAAWALGEIGPEAADAVPALETAAQDPAIGTAAREALTKIRGK